MSSRTNAFAKKKLNYKEIDCDKIRIKHHEREKKIKILDYADRMSMKSTYICFVSLIYIYENVDWRKTAKNEQRKKRRNSLDYFWKWNPIQKKSGRRWRGDKWGCRVMTSAYLNFFVRCLFKHFFLISSEQIYFKKIFKYWKKFQLIKSSPELCSTIFIKNN